jgi:hypothetical protein
MLGLVAERWGLNLSRFRGLRIGLAAVALLSLGAARQPVTRVEGVTFGNSGSWRGAEFELQGAALLRYRVLLKGYVAALYLGSGVSAERVLADVPRRLEIEYFWAIPADAFASITTERIAREASAATRDRLGEPLAKLNALYRGVQAGDRYALTYVPGKGTELALNGVPLGVVEGAEFSSALFAIWLGEQPLDEALRERLLARS